MAVERVGYCESEIGRGADHGTFDDHGRDGDVRHGQGLGSAERATKPSSEKEQTAGDQDGEDDVEGGGEDHAGKAPVHGVIAVQAGARLHGFVQEEDAGYYVTKLEVSKRFK